MNDRELGGLNGSEANEDDGAAGFNVEFCHCAAIASDEVGLLSFVALERAVDEQRHQIIAGRESNSTPERFSVWLRCREPEDRPEVKLDGLLQGKHWDGLIGGMGRIGVGTRLFLEVCTRAVTSLG
jgi:hypothetical protein